MGSSIVIIGGGISGLYVAYHLLKRDQGYRVTVIEKGSRLGGRVATFSDSSMTVEMGAARFREDHVLLVSLLKDLGLWSRRSKNSSKVGHYFIDSLGVSHFMNSIIDYDLLRGQRAPLELVADGVLDIASQSGLPNVGLVARIMAAGLLTSKATLISMSFLDFAKTVLDTRDVDFLVGSFGYYSELVLMNAYDCLQLMQELDPRTPFYSLKGGLSLVIDELARRIRAMGGIIRTGVQVTGIREHRKAGFIVTCSTAEAEIADSVVCALRKKDLERFSIFRPIMPMLRGLLTAPLCRIYAKYSTRSGDPWFKGLTKLTINNELRMMIPISESEGIIMISYSDNKFADFWDRVYRRGGESGLNRVLQEKVWEALRIVIPDADEIRAFYWEGGVGYWGVGIDSSDVSRRIVRPFSHLRSEDKNLFICGENFSAGHQQWIEGALETGAAVVESICGTSASS
jgi:hypothetical protein